MNKRIKLLVMVITLCVIPLVSLGWLTYGKLEKQYVSDTKQDDLFLLKNISAMLQAVYPVDSNNGSEQFSKQVRKAFTALKRDEHSLFLFNRDGSILASSHGGRISDSPVLVAYREIFLNNHDQWSNLTRDEDGIHFLLQHIPVGKTGLQLLSVTDGLVIESALKRLQWQTALYCSAAIIATCASGFLVFAFFTTQSAILRNFVSRLVTVEGSVLPEVAPSGEFHDVSNAFIKFARREKEYKNELLAINVTDPLTGVLNNKEIFAKLASEMSKAKRYATPLSILLVDIDHFRRINDRFGYTTGDQILCRFTAILDNSLRTHDLIGRDSRDVFIIILPLTDRKYAINVADRIRAAVEVSYWGEPDLQLTISGGVCQMPQEEDMDVQKVLSDLTRQAKRLGRNRIEHDLVV